MPTAPLTTPPASRATRPPEGPPRRPLPDLSERHESLTPVVDESASPQSFMDQIRSFGAAFWMVNAMEGIERWAYYGVRSVLSIFIVLAAADGGLGFDHVQKGTIYSWWAVVLCVLPMFTGGLADRYGYKNMIGLSIGIKVAGYMMMATQRTFFGFFMGCMLLAAGTGLFKPGIQGILAHSTNARNASLGWGVFYMLVNIGGFLGPWMAGGLRMIDWSYVFYANAALVALNYVMLYFLREPEGARLAAAEAAARSDASPLREFAKVMAASLKNLLQPRLLSFLVIYSGFWLMFMQLFDLLPNFIDDWVNSAPLLGAAGSFLGVQAWVASAATGTQIQPEWMINIDAGAIVLLMMPVAALFSRTKPLFTMIGGMAVAALGLVMAGATMGGGLCALGILVFALGEMMASPKLNEYLAEIAPSDQKGLYLGYANMPLAIGWGFGSSLGGSLYQTYADKITLARHYLAANLGLGQSYADAIPRERVMDTLADALHQTPMEVTALLFNLNHPQQIWYYFAAIGMASLVGLVAYHLVVSRPSEARRPDAAVA